MMLSDNLKNCRQKCGYTQEEVAEQLHIVRQTLSKWEKGVSVPDADMLVKLAKLYEVDVNELLGTMVQEIESQEELIAKELAKVNEQLALKNRRSKTFWCVILIIGILISIWGGTGCAYAIMNYEMTLRDTTFAADTAMMILEGCIVLFRKNVLRVAFGVIMAVVAGFMRKK